MALDVVHWGGAWGPAPAVVATSAWNGMGFTPHQIWAWRRAEMNALAESPFLNANGSRATMAHIRTLPPRARSSERLWAVAEALVKPLLQRLEALPTGSRVALVLGLAERFADGAPARMRVGRGELERGLLALFESQGLEVIHTVVPRGHAGFAHGVIEACAALTARQVEAAVVGGVDTYYDPDVVESLILSKRLFDGENLDSFIPGEGGAFCLLTRGDVATRSRWPVLARIESAASNEEPAHMGTDLPCLGLGLSRPLRAISDRLEQERRLIDLWLGDLTNENYRTQEWMLAFPRASAGVSAPESDVQFLPVFLGDLGAATMPTGAVLAVESFLRGDLPASTCVVMGSSVGEHRGAVLLTRELGTARDAGPASLRAPPMSVRASVIPPPMPSARVSEVVPAAPSLRPSELPAPVPSFRPSELPSPVPSFRPSELPAPVPSSRFSEIVPAMPGSRASDVPAPSMLGLVSYASACAEAAVRPERAAAAWAKYGLAGAAIEEQHRAWREHFDASPEERAEFERYFEQFKAHWRVQRT
jgi:3-oxoacyl-[acyl-carrier-protein] synthase-1